jgi:hypothetical protein
MKYQYDVTETVTLVPADVYDNKEVVKHILEASGTEIVGFRPPKQGEKCLSWGDTVPKVETAVNDWVASKYGGKIYFSVGPRFIVESKKPANDLPEWE